MGSYLFLAIRHELHLSTRYGVDKSSKYRTASRASKVRSGIYVILQRIMAMP